MKKSNKTWLIIGFIVVIGLIVYYNESVKKTAYPPVDANQFWQDYKPVYIKPSGAVISNAEGVGWCNAGMGCGDEVSSEGTSRALVVALRLNDKATFDQVLNFMKTKQQNPRTGWLMWKIKQDGTVVSNGGGQNTAIDAELIAAGALFEAEDKWPGNNYRRYGMSLLNSLRPGFIQGKYIPFCEYENGNSGLPCGHDKAPDMVYLGYINLPVLKKACSYDSSWCEIYNSQANIMRNSVTAQGAYSGYSPSQNKYYYLEAHIHPNWVLKHLTNDGGDSWTKVKPLYDKARQVFMTSRASGGSQICREQNPDSGCVITDPDWNVYGNYMEMAKARGDTEYANALGEVIAEKKMWCMYKPLMAADNYGNIVMLEALSLGTQSTIPTPTSTPRPTSTPAVFPTPTPSTRVDITMVPYTCSGLKCKFTSGVTSGGCRTLTFNSGVDTIKVMACLKDNNYIEVYRQVYPTWNFKVCFDTGCVDNNQGFARFQYIPKRQICNCYYT